MLHGSVPEAIGTYEFDAAGRLVQIIDGHGNVTTLAYALDGTDSGPENASDGGVL